MSKAGSLVSALGSLISLLLRVSITIIQYGALYVSLGFSAMLLGKYTNNVIQSRKNVLELVYWRDPRKSGAMLAILFFVLYLFQKFTVLAIFVYSALGFLLATIGLRLYKLAETNFRKENDGGNPFQHFLDLELSVPVDKLHNYVDVVIEHAMSFFKKLRHIYLVENLLDSIKFGLLLYSLTYVAGWFSGVTLITLFIIAVFTVPKTYELYKEPIDNYIKLIWEQIEHYSNMVQEKLPFLKMALAPEKKEE